MVVGTDGENVALYEEHPHKVFIVTRKELVSLFQKSDVYHEVAAMLPKNTLKPHGTTRVPRQAKKIQASWKLLKKAMCPCLRFPNAPDVCSCKICTLFEQNLYRYHRARDGWHQAKGENAAGAHSSCAACNGECRKRTLYRTFSSSASTAVSSITCRSHRQPHLAMPARDKNDRLMKATDDDAHSGRRKLNMRTRTIELAWSIAAKCKASKSSLL